MPSSKDLGEGWDKFVNGDPITKGKGEGPDLRKAARSLLTINIQGESPNANKTDKEKNWIKTSASNAKRGGGFAKDIQMDPLAKVGSKVMHKINRPKQQVTRDHIDPITLKPVKGGQPVTSSPRQGTRQGASSGTPGKRSRLAPGQGTRANKNVVPKQGMVTRRTSSGRELPTGTKSHNKRQIEAEEKYAADAIRYKNALRANEVDRKGPK